MSERDGGSLREEEEEEEEEEEDLDLVDLPGEEGRGTESEEPEGEVGEKEHGMGVSDVAAVMALGDALTSKPPCSISIGSGAGH